MQSNFYTKVTSIAIFSLINVLTTIQVANADITSNAYIGLIAGPDYHRSSTLNSTVMSQVTSNGAAAHATSSTSLSFGTFASSENMGLAIQSTGAAGYSNVYYVKGNTKGATLPLTFNFDVRGNLYASSEAGNMSSLSLASIIFSTKTGSSGTSATYMLENQGGMPIPINKGGTFDGDVNINISQVSASIAGKNYVLDNTILARLGINIGPISSIDFGIKDQSFFSDLGTKIESDIFNLGLPEYQLPAGTTGKVGFDVSYTFHGSTHVTANVKSIDALMVSMQSDAASSPNDAIGISNYSGNAFYLKSVTVPADYNAVDITGLMIDFDSGLIMPITRENVMETPLPPAITFLVTGLPMLVLFRSGRRKRGGSHLTKMETNLNKCCFQHENKTGESDQFSNR